jgi:putative transposase
MTTERKKRIAEFRFAVIADLVGWRKLCWGERSRILRGKSEQEWDIPYSGRTRVSAATIAAWVKRYEESGRQLSSLYPRGRADKGTYRSLDEDTIQTLLNLKREMRGAPLPVILRQAKVRKLLPADFKVNPSTIYRLFQEHGLMDKEREPVDRRRFQAELANEMWQSDAMHGPVVETGGKRRKTYLFAFIDDCSRLVPHAEFYLNERLNSYIDALKKALSKRGLPRKLYVDNGPSFRSHHLAHITASLGIALIHSRPYKPEGRGKIERWFKTVRSSFLTTLPDRLTLDELNAKLFAWVESGYNRREHSSIGEKPLTRYLEHIHLIREVPKDMEEYFRKCTTRRVHKDRTVSLCGRLYEAPVGLIGKIITLHYHEHDPSRVDVVLKDQSYGFLVPLDLHINSKIRRDRTGEEKAPRESAPVRPDEKNHYTGGRLFDPEKDHDEL